MVASVTAFVFVTKSFSVCLEDLTVEISLHTAVCLSVLWNVTSFYTQSKKSVRQRSPLPK